VVRAACGIKVKSPDDKRWEKVKAIFDPEASEEQISKVIVDKLAMKVEFGEKIFVHVNILGEILSWPFRVVQKLPADLLFGREFIQINGIIVSSDGRGVKFAPGYPQSPVI